MRKLRAVCCIVWMSVCAAKAVAAEDVDIGLSTSGARIQGSIVEGPEPNGLTVVLIGGIVFGLQVVRADGRPVDWSTAIVRALGCFLSLVVVGLGFIWIAFDDQRQGWHDKIAGTVVVRVPKGVSLL